MFAFVKYNLLKLFTVTHLFVVAIYLSFAWFLSTPNLDFSSVYNSLRLTKNYDLILFSVALLNYILFVNNHFRDELITESYNLLAVRLTNNEIFWGLILVYLIYFLVGFATPFYCTALFQQLYYAPSKVELSIFLLKILSILTSYLLFWTVFSLWLKLLFRNDIIELLIFVFVYCIFLVFNLLTSGLLFNQTWFIDNIFSSLSSGNWSEKMIIWLLFISISIVLGKHISRKLTRLNLIEKYKIGIFSTIAGKLKAFLSMHHYNMIGLSNQRILTFFTTIGFVFIVFLVQNKNFDLLLLGNLYIGVFVPVLFSFNQYYIIKIDKDAGMIHNNFLREIPYARIILFRWFILLLPQLLVALLLTLTLKVFIVQIHYSFVIYIILLNVLFSLINLCFSIATQEGMIANIFLLFFVYVQLREDTQNLINSNLFLKQLNIFYNLLQPEYVVELHYLFLIMAVVAFLLYSSIKMIGRLKYVSLSNS
ncbi:MAG: hypothetical protein ABI638_13775 [Ignavibacteriota bacterium]